MLLVSSAVLLRNYHLSHLPLHRTPTRLLSLASFSSPSFIFTPLVEEEEEEEEEVAAVDTTAFRRIRYPVSPPLSAPITRHRLQAERLERRDTRNPCFRSLD